MKLTRSILDKEESALSKEEKELVDEYKKTVDRHDRECIAANRILREECEMACSGEEKTLIPAYGWIEPVKKMAYAIEKLNYDNRKYGLKVNFGQVKEKFGLFTAYWDMNAIPTGVAGFFYRIVCNISNAFQKIDYKRKWVSDVPSHDEIKWRECTEAEFKEGLDEYGNKIPESKRTYCEEGWHYVKATTFEKGNVVEMAYRFEKGSESVELKPGKTVFRKYVDDKFLRGTWVYVLGKSHMEIGKHRLLWKMNAMFLNLKTWLCGFRKNSPEIQVRERVFCDEVDKLVAECEKECNSRCMVCGCRISDDDRDCHQDKCETHGWITYVCDDCADIIGGCYYNEATKKWMNEGVETEDPYKSKKKN